MVPLSGWPALHTGPLSKNRKKKFVSYDIYGFAINRIYTKTLQYVYLGFSLGVKVVRKSFFECEKKAVASDSRKKTVRNAVNRASFVAAKRSFQDVLLDLISINFRILIDLGHPGDAFDVGYLPFERSPEAAISHGAASGASVAIM